MGTISYLKDCCNSRKKKVDNEENVEKFEEASPVEIIQAAAGEEKKGSEPQARPMNDDKQQYNDVKDEKNSKISKKTTENTDNFELISRHLSNKGDFLIKVFVEFLEITYKLCDDFGNYFKPFVEVVFDSQKKVLSFSDDKLNTSNISDNAGNNNTDMNNSFNMNNVSGFERMKSQGTSSGKEKFYQFKTEEVLSGNPLNSYSSLSFIVKNTNVHSHLTPAHPSIIIGESHVPINLISESKKGVFDGYLRVRLRNIQEIGKLKVKIVITDKNAASSILEEKHDTDNSFLNNSLDRNLMSIQPEFWEDELINFSDIDPNLIKTHFFKGNLDNKEKHFRLALKIIKEKVYDAALLHKFYLECINDQNFVALYQILNQLLKLAQYLDFNPINEFFRLLGEIESEKFYKIPETTNYNVYILERFLMFIFYSQKYFKTNRSLIIRNNRFLNDAAMIDMIYRNVKNLIELYKQNAYDVLYSQVIRECLIWCQNNIYELLTQPTSSKDSSEELLKSEYTSIYNSCINVMSYRICLLKMIDIYSIDSQLMSGLFRMFRKATQLITNHGTSMLDRSKIDGRPKEISKKFKILLVDKYEGIFIYSLRIMIQKYNHYPELHVNILIILFQITTGLDYKALLVASNKLSLKEFGEGFIIYRGKLKVFSKLINNLHLNVLANFSEITKNEDIIRTEKVETITEYENCLIDIYADLKNFFKLRKNNKKRVEEFIQNKQNELDIHEIIARIYNNLTKSDVLFKLLMEDSCIIEDLIDYLSKFSGKFKSKDNKEFLRGHLEKKSKDPSEQRKMMLSITENTLSIFINLIPKGRENKLEFRNFVLSLPTIYTKNYILSVINNCYKNLKEFQIFSSKLESNYNEAKELIEKSWS